MFSLDYFNEISLTVSYTAQIPLPAGEDKARVMGVMLGQVVAVLGTLDYLLGHYNYSVL